MKIRYLGPLLLVLFALSFQGARGLWEPDEGRYTAVALQMLRTGDFMLPSFNAEQPHLTKPPLTYWAIAGSLAAFGRTTWAARLPSGLAFVGTVLLVGWLGRRLLPTRPWLPALVYALMLLPVSGGAVVNTDSILTFWETLAAAGFTLAYFGPEPRPVRAGVTLMWAAFGFAFLTKGPPGLLPLPVFAGVALFLRRPGRRYVFFLPALLLFAVLAFGWFLILDRHVPGLIAQLWRGEVVDRVARGTHHRNAAWHGPLDIYVPTLLLGTIPWTWVFLRALPRLRRLARRSYRRDLAARDPGLLLLLLWFLVPFAVFVFARSRLSYYILPLFVPLSILIARELEPGLRRWGRRPRRLLVAWAVFLVAARAASGWVPSHADAQAYAREIHRSVPVPFQEIVFVDTSPHYGLSFYCNVPVEVVTLGPGQAWERGLGRRQDLAEELAEPETRLFILPERHRERFLAEAVRLGFLPREWGGRQGDWFYSLEPASPRTALEGDVRKERPERPASPAAGG